METESMKLNNYQMTLLMCLNQPGKPRYSVDELRSHGIEYDQDEFWGLYSSKYLRFERRGPQRELVYYIGPMGEKAVEDYRKEQEAVEKADKYNAETLRAANLANQLAKEANQKSTYANRISLIALFIAILPWVYQLIKKIISLF